MKRKLSREEFLKRCRDGSIYDEDYFERGRYESCYSGYNRSLADSAIFKEYARLIKEAFNPKKVLEVGCATGIIVKNLQELGIDAYGIDVSEYAVSHAVTKNIFRMNMTRLNFPSNSFDLVFGNHCIEHLFPDMLSRAIQEQKRVTRRYVFHILPIWGLGKYKWSREERGRLLQRNATDLILETKDWWIQNFEKEGLHYTEDIKLLSKEPGWVKETYNETQLLFVKEDTFAKEDTLTAYLNFTLRIQLEKLKAQLRRLRS